MPIKPENRARYPKDWKRISASIRERAGHKCELCGVPNYAVVKWLDGKWVEVIPGTLGNYAAARQIAAEESIGWEQGDPKAIVIVLTVAHLDHTPENCDPENLRAWCQRCHLDYDKYHHRANSAATRKARKAVGDLFESASQ